MTQIGQTEQEQVPFPISVVRAVLGIEGQPDPALLERMCDDDDVARAFEAAAREAARDDEDVAKALEAERESLEAFVDSWQSSPTLQLAVTEERLEREGLADEADAASLSIAGVRVPVARWLKDQLAKRGAQVESAFDATRQAAADAWRQIEEALREELRTGVPGLGASYGSESITAYALSPDEEDAEEVRVKISDVEAYRDKVQGRVEAFDPRFQNYGVLVQVSHEERKLRAGFAFGRLTGTAEGARESRSYGGVLKLSRGVDVGEDALPLDARHLMVFLVEPEIAEKLEDALERSE